VAVLAMLATAAGIYLATTTITTRNKTGQTLSAVKIGFTENLLWEGALKAGASKWTPASSI
jgi:hypothetical protein